MKGIIFNLLQEVVAGELGDPAWDDAVNSAGADGAYTSLGSYPDQEFVSLIRRLALAREASEPETLRWFGRRAMPLLADRYPGFFRDHPGTVSFLLTLNDVIHSEVRKLYPAAHVPVFDFELPSGEPNGTLALRYRSERRLCALAEGFIAGAADHFSEHVEIEQPACMHRGDEECVFRCSFEPAGMTA